MFNGRQFFALLLGMLLGMSNEVMGQHLFILSGQSNMVRMDENQTFIPMLEHALGKEQVIVVKDAHGGQPISQWFAPYSLYDSLMQKIDEKNLTIEKMKTITFIWMQGERDAREQLGEIYEERLWALYHKLSDDLKVSKLHFIIGRINDFDLDNDHYPHWTMIRAIQENVAQARPHFEWVNTDDLNDGYDQSGIPIKNDLHLTPDGYDTLGERFAAAALRLIANY